MFSSASEIFRVLQPHQTLILTRSSIGRFVDGAGLKFRVLESAPILRLTGGLWRRAVQLDKTASADTGPGRTMTVVSTGWHSSPGMQTRRACSRTAAPPFAWEAQNVPRRPSGSLTTQLRIQSTVRNALEGALRKRTLSGISLFPMRADLAPVSLERVPGQRLENDLIAKNGFHFRGSCSSREVRSECASLRFCRCDSPCLSGRLGDARACLGECRR
jgi:hypothetical protein